MPGIDARATFHRVFDGIGRFVERRVNFGISRAGFNAIMNGVLSDPALNTREVYITEAVDNIIGTINDITSLPEAGRKRRIIDHTLRYSLESEEPWLRIADSMPGVSGMDAPTAAIIGSALLTEMRDILRHPEDPRCNMLARVITEIGRESDIQIQAARKENEQSPTPLRTQTLEIFTNAEIHVLSQSRRRQRRQR